MKTSAFVLLAAAMALSACAPESSSLKGRRDLPDVRVNVDQPEIPKNEKAAPQVEAPKVEKPGLNWITQDGGQRQFEFNPRLDILFVVDNSDSMKEEQENLSRNMNRFAQDLRKNRMIDYHIGVVSVWDDSDRAVSKAKYKNGELRRVRDGQGRTLGARFLTRATKDDALLAPTLKIGVVPYAEGGPEKEQIFSPIANALQRIGHADTNENFFRDDAPLVIVIVTDADDSTPNLTPEQMADDLFKFKGDRKDQVTVYGVLTRKSDPDSVKDWDLRVHPKYHPECFEAVKTTVPAKKKGGKATVKTEMKLNGKCAGGFGPDRLEQFIQFANAQHHRPDQVEKELILSLNQADYGKDLAKIGGDIAIRALEKEIVLDQRPRTDENGELLLKVYYNGALIPAGRQKGWTYNQETNTVHLAGDIVYKYSENARFMVKLVPVDYNRADAPVADPAAAAN